MHVGHFQVLLTVSGGTRQVGAHVARLATRVPSRESESATMLNQAAREGPAQAHKDQHTETATWGTPMHVCFFCFSFIMIIFSFFQATKRCRTIWGNADPVTHGSNVLHKITSVKTEESLSRTSGQAYWAAVAGVARTAGALVRLKR